MMTQTEYKESDMLNFKNYPINLKEVINAEKIVRQNLKESSLCYYKNLSDLIGADIYIKHENHNIGGSFKIRGGLNLMHHIKKHSVNGVITFSTGNHGISIATSAKLYGIDATIVVPEGSNESKIERIKDSGAKLIVAGKNFEESIRVVQEMSQKENLYCIHAANEPHLINGVGTEFLEIIRDLNDIDVIILPIGAGSELAAATTVFKTLNPDIEIIAVQAESSKAGYLSWKNKTITQSENNTFAGGFATGSAYEVPFNIYKDALTDFVLLTEDELKEGIAMAMNYTKNLTEGAGSSTIRAALKIKDKLQGKKVVLQMSGCNEDNNILKEVVEKYFK